MIEESQPIKVEKQNAVGLAAKQLCSLVFVSGLSPERAKTCYIDGVLDRFGFRLSVDYDTSRRMVTVSCPGIGPATAEFRDGIGCTITTKTGKNNELPQVDLPEVQNFPLREGSPKEIARNFDKDAVETALHRAFSPDHNTLAVTILHKGKLVAEKYAPGITSKTPLPGWSMAKSVTATLVGILVKRGKLDINQPGIVQAWRNHNDGSNLVTINHLLRMTSGLDLVEDQSGHDPNSRMIFFEADAAAFAAKRGIRFPPGSYWEYMSGNTILACKTIFELTGGTLQSSQTFYREVFMKPLGAPSFTFETDAAGTFIGSSYLIATPHDWAKFGELYLDDGITNGERVLPEGWVEYVTRHTPLSGSNSYGAGFWTVENNNPHSLPPDTFYANGFQGQYVIVIPSKALVLVRLGASLAPDGIWQLVKDMLSAIN